MDPLSVTAFAFTTIGVIYKTAKTITDFTGFLSKAKGIGNTLTNLVKELESLGAEVSTINDILRFPAFVLAVRRFQDHCHAQIFGGLQENLKGCTDTVKRLDEIVTKLTQDDIGKFRRRVEAQ